MFESNIKINIDNLLELFKSKKTSEKIKYVPTTPRGKVEYVVLKKTKEEMEYVIPGNDGDNVGMDSYEIDSDGIDYVIPFNL